MVGKLAFLVVSMGAVGCALLGLRQQRIEAVSAMARVNLRIMECDRHLATLRSEIASSIEPKRIESLALGLGPLRPLEIVPRRSGLPGGVKGPVYASGEGSRAQRGEGEDGAFGGGVNRR